MVIRCMLIFSFSCKKLNKFKYVFATDRFVPGFGLDKFPFVCVSVMKVRTPCRILSISLDIKLDTCTITRNFYRSMSLIHPAAASRNCSFFPSYDFKTHFYYSIPSLKGLREIPRSQTGWKNSEQYITELLFWLDIVLFAGSDFPKLDRVNPHRGLIRNHVSREGKAV